MRREVSVALVDEPTAPLQVGDWVLIHVGFALARIDEDDARPPLELLAKGAELQRELDEMEAGRHVSGLLPEHCLTCSDEAVEAVVAEVDGATAAVTRRRHRRSALAIDLVPDAAPGDVLLCHAGIALERVERP